MVLYLKLLEVRLVLKKLYFMMCSNDTSNVLPKDSFEVSTFNWEYLLNADLKFFCKLWLSMQNMCWFR